MEISLGLTRVFWLVLSFLNSGEVSLEVYPCDCVNVLKIVCYVVFKRMTFVNETCFLHNLVSEQLLAFPLSSEIRNLCFAFDFF